MEEVRDGEVPSSGRHCNCRTKKEDARSKEVESNVFKMAQEAIKLEKEQRKAPVEEKTRTRTSAALLMKRHELQEKGIPLEAIDKQLPMP